MTDFAQQRLKNLRADHDALIARPNAPQPGGNGVYQRYQHPVVTAAHAPLEWRYDLNPVTNPFMMERMGINATFNAGAMLWQGQWSVSKAMIVSRSSPSLKAQTVSTISAFGPSLWSCRKPKNRTPMSMICA